MVQDKSTLNTYITKINDHFDGAKVVEYYFDTRNKYGVASITGKIEGGIQGITAVMKAVFGKSTKVQSMSGEEAKLVSGKYDSFLVLINDKQGFFFRSIIGNKGSLTDKDLTPSKLGLAGTKLTKRNIQTVVESGLAKQQKIPMEILALGKELLTLSKSSGQTIQLNEITKSLVSAISPTDLKKIGKNYGEVVISNWCLYNKKGADSVYFPPEENNPLADFVVSFTTNSKTPDLNVSAKFEGGANSSLKSILQENSKPPNNATKEEQLAFEAVMAVAFDKIIDGLLRAEKILNTPEYKAIKNMCVDMGHRDVTLQTISDVVESALTAAGISKSTKITPAKHEAYKKIMAPFYSSINYAGFPKIDSMQKIAALGKGKFYHPVFYSFSVALADRFNKGEAFKSVLNKAANSIKAEQIYLDINSSNMVFKTKVFSESKFVFAPGAFAYSADNVRMKVSMVK